MVNVLVSGWYGFGNLGDEAILYAIARTLGRELEDVRVTALSYDVAFTGSYQGIESAPQLPAGVKSWAKSLLRGELYRTLRMMARCDVLLLGGGGFLSDWQPEAPWVWLRQALLAKVLGKKVMLYGIGAGPFTRFWGKLVTRTLVNGCVDAVTVRDDESRRWLLEAGVNGTMVRVTADPAVRFPAAACRARGGQRPPKTVGICLAPVFHSERLWPGKRHKYDRYLAAMRRVSAELVALGFAVRFLSMQEKSDGAFGREILAGLAGDAQMCAPARDMVAAVAQLAEVDILVTMRFHAAILGALQGVPVAAIIYHHKVAEFVDSIGMRGFAQELGDGSNWKEADIDPQLLVRNIGDIAADYQGVCDRMQGRIALLQQRELDNVRILRALIAGGP